MSTLTKEIPKTPAQKQKWVEGKSYICILSKSPGYKLSSVYVAYKNEDGILCLRGSDGFED